MQHDKLETYLINDWRTIRNMKNINTYYVYHNNNFLYVILSTAAISREILSICFMGDSHSYNSVKFWGQHYN